MWLTYYLGVFLRSQIFDVGNGNEDKDQLVNPASYGLENTANFYFPSMDKTFVSERVGAWLISPLPDPSTVSRSGNDEACVDKDCTNAELGVEELSHSDCVFILLHGNAKNRGAAHRVAAYKIFQSLGCYTLTVDYRGYGDSIMSQPINETTLVEDAKAAIKFIRDIVGDKPKLIIYGHSMGTGITPHAVVEAHAEGLGRVDGIILDSPFHSFKYAMQSTFLGRLFDTTQFLKDIALEFDNPGWLAQLDIPVRVFHATVDPVTPIQGSRDLVEDVKAGGKSNIDLKVWEEEGLGHIGISTTNNFKEEIKRFLDAVTVKQPVLKSKL